MAKLTKAEQETIFAKGFGKIKMFKVVDYGMTTEYIKNPKMSQSQQNKAETFTIDATPTMRKKSAENKAKSEAKKPKEISILEYAKRVAKANKGKIYHKSKSGSVYVRIGTKEVRISNHFIIDRNPNEPKIRHDWEIVQKNFDESDAVIVDFK